MLAAVPICDANAPNAGGQHPVIHASASVAPDAQIGHDTRVWDHAKIREGVVIGTDCIIGGGVYIDFDVRIGDRVKIQNNALVYHGVTVGSGVFIGPGAILTNDRFPRSVASDGRLSGADDWTVSRIDLADGCSIGAGAIVVAGCDVGTWATIGAGAVVTRPIPAHALAVGSPARVIGWVCRCGRRLVDASGTPVTASTTGAARCPREEISYVIQEGTCTAKDEG